MTMISLHATFQRMSESSMHVNRQQKNVNRNMNGHSNFEFLGADMLAAMSNAQVKMPSKWFEMFEFDCYSVPTLVFPGTMYANRGKHAEKPGQVLSFE